MFNVRFRVIGYYGIFGSYVIVSIINIFYIVLFVKETRGPRAHPRYITDAVASDLGSDPEQRPKNLLSVAHLRSVFSTAMKSRPNNMRAVLLMLITAMILNMSATNSKCTIINDVGRNISVYSHNYL